MAETSIIGRIWEQKMIFVLVFVGVFTVSYGILYAIDFVPEPIDEKEGVLEAVEATVVNEAEEMPSIAPFDPTPNRIIIDKLDREVEILNPATSDIEELDEALLSGVVRHPDSADFTEDGTMFLLGHSSYLPTVFNRNFQAFNGIEDLVWGDRIRVQSNNIEYVYRVDIVYEAKASEAEIEIVTGEPRLALATCDSFGSKDDRFVVEATLIDSYSIGEKSST